MLRRAGSDRVQARPLGPRYHHHHHHDYYYYPVGNVLGGNVFGDFGDNILVGDVILTILVYFVLIFLVVVLVLVVAGLREAFDRRTHSLAQRQASGAGTATDSAGTSASTMPQHSSLSTMFGHCNSSSRRGAVSLFQTITNGRELGALVEAVPRHGPS